MLISITQTHKHTYTLETTGKEKISTSITSVIPTTCRFRVFSTLHMQTAWCTFEILFPYPSYEVFLSSVSTFRHSSPHDGQNVKLFKNRFTKDAILNTKPVKRCNCKLFLTQRNTNHFNFSTFYQCMYVVFKDTYYVFKKTRAHNYIMRPQVIYLYHILVSLSQY